jgi:hypothetical protein
MESEVLSPTPNALQIQGEANIASSAARTQAETQAAIMVAQRFRRSEPQCRQDLINAVKASPRLAEKAAYSYPRGKKKDPVTGEWVENIISGPSTYIAREAARVWGNLAYGTEVVRDTDGERQIRSFAWDMQTNMRCIAEASFKKLVQRTRWIKKPGSPDEKVSEWVEPDERDLRELSNKYSSIGERNCILKVIPSHLVDEVLEMAKQTTKEDAAKHPDAVRARLTDAFQSLGITVAMLEEYLHHSLKETTPDKMTDLRGIFTSIREGNSVWEDYRSSTLPSDEDVPQMPQLRELAKRIKWNDAKLSSEVGRHLSDIPKLLAMMSEVASKAAALAAKAPAATTPAPETSPETSPLTQAASATEGEVIPAPQQAQRRTRQATQSAAQEF